MRWISTTCILLPDRAVIRALYDGGVRFTDREGLMWAAMDKDGLLGTALVSLLNRRVASLNGCVF